MKKLLLLPALLLFSGPAFGQTNVPPCDPNNPPPNCTDYFGVANWANSPLPAGSITGFTVVASGSGYANPVVVITDASGAGATAPTTFTFDATFGILTITGGGGGSGYIAPQITIVDVGAGGTLAGSTCGGVNQPACGSGALATAVLGGPFTGGVRKFVDQLTLPLANLQLATPDTATFPGSDFYVIALTQYTTKMHTDLPATMLRGYCQLIPPATTCTPSYLGPTILAQKDRPVRVLFKNMLPTGAGGNLFIPVDTTYMGAGAPYTQNRATLHLHGGATPWISDGTPHQWTAPAGELGPARGDSVQFVPDMWFDASGNLVAAGTPGATNDPGPGNLTFFWTNQQGGRLMFYHDHAYGITRLNVYAGEAAGYLLVDPAEESALAAATVPGTITGTPDLAHLVPLVIQDKTFVPSAAQLAAQDPTWTAGKFGTVPGFANPGDLWFPHVYTPNQNPADVGGANAFGRWDYGPWTLPGNQTVLLAGTPTVGDVTIPCISSAFPNQAVNCPITPNASGTPESFMDTPLVNGKAYPVLHVAPAAYRFRILSAGNDRSLNLQFYVADPAVVAATGAPFPNTEVKMVPAIQPGPTSPLQLCTALTPITNTTLFMGLATALLDGSGNPINGTGLPANCWPNFGAGSQTAGIPIQQTMWGADGRFGGVPDPTTAGPPFIQIGTEGGLLPAPVVIPSMPTGYEANTRSVTITNVSVHGLWLGPAERADAIVDFSKFGGKTLILYNDAPTPAPAVDSRLDYFTGDGDQTAIGGAPNTMPGYGPNTRTIMQIVVDQTAPNTTPFSLAALQGALPSIFAQTQPVPIVPEPTYPPASGGFSATPTYSLITDASLTFFPIGSTTPVTYTDERKTIQELFTLDYGRMNATLGVELPLTNFLTQTTIPLGYIDPPTETIKQGDTQLWHITHNGVDTHFIHFHLFNVQVINRSAWDGTKRPPDQNELGWKDTVRMNPLEDILVALKPIQPVPPFPVRDSYRPMDVTMPAGSDCAAITLPGTPTPAPCSIFTNIDPATNIGTQTPNAVINFGWEYVWHCHILGHEENDMMRAITFNVPPEAPSNLTVAAAVSPSTGLNLTWTDNSASETGFTLQRDTTAAFASPTPIPVGPSTPTGAGGQGITWGGPIVFNDAGADSSGVTTYFYRVQAFKPDANYWTPSPNITSAWSNTATFGTTVPFAGVSPTTLAFGNVSVGTPSAPQTVLLSNTGTGQFTYTTAILGANLGDFAVTDTPCAGTAVGKSSCALTVTFTPTITGPESASLTIATTDAANPTLTVLLTGTGGTLPLLTITASNATMKYGGAVPLITPSYNPANPAGPLTAPTCTTTATNTSPVGTYPTTCSLAVDANYTITYVAGTVSVTPVPLTIWAPNASTVVGAVPASFTPAYVGFVAGDTASTLSVLPNVAPTCTTTATSSSPISPPTYAITCLGAVDNNYNINYVPGILTITKGLMTITAPSPTMPYGGPIPTLTPVYNPVNPLGLTTPATCTTTATVNSSVGTYPVTCSGAVDPNYTITYVAGILTVTTTPLTITASSATVLYGAAVPAITPAYSGFVLGQGPGNLTGVVTCSTTYTPGSLVSGSPYPTTCAGATSTNYAITYPPGKVTVNAAPLSIAATPSSTTMTYGGAVPTITPTYSGFVLGQGPVNLTGTVTCSANVTSTTPVGSYSSTCSGATSTNYAITYVPGVVTINKASTSTRITSNTPNPSTLQQPVTVAFSVAPQFTGTPSGNVVVTASTGETCTGTVAVGSCPITFLTVGTRTLTASYGGDTNFLASPASAGVSQTVNAPIVSLSPPNVNFGKTSVGATSGPKAETIANTGTGALINFSWSITGPNAGNFSIASTTCTATLAPGASCVINITFTPSATGARTASLTLKDNALNSPQTVGLSGSGK